MDLDKIRAAARHGAWKEGTNPFGRTTSRTQRQSAASRVEEGLAEGPGSRLQHQPSAHSENCAIDIENSAAGPSQTAPKRSETTPIDRSEPQSTVSQHPPIQPLENSFRGAESESSTIPLSNGMDRNGSEGPRNRKRPGLLTEVVSFKAFGKRRRDDTDDIKDEEEKKKHDRFKKRIPWQQQLRAVLYPQWLTVNWLLLLVPVGIVSGNISSFPPIAVFVINFIAIVPLAAVLSYATEEIALRVGETLGGLLNASFGNAVELIVGIIALVKHEIVIVQSSLIGSMLSNLLLVLGMCFFLGGINRLEQNFNVTVAQTAASLLALCIGCLVIPTAFTWGVGSDGDKDEQISRGTSIIMLFVYVSYLFFQLKSHKEVFNEPSAKVQKRKSSKKQEGESITALATIGAGQAAHAGGDINRGQLMHNSSAEEDDDDEEEPQLSLIGAMVTLTVSTALVGLCAEYLVDSISEVTVEYGVSQYFVGLILLPIVGNAAEHATAITVSMKDKMDLAIGVAVGSSMQIALLVLPLMVVLAWIIGGPDRDMTLVFDSFQITVIFIAVLLVNYLISDGKSHWLEGVLLMSLYVIIAVASWFYPTREEQPEDAQ